VSFGDWIAVGTVAIAGLGVIAALKGVRDQLRMSTFLAYTERYASLMARMPFEARRPGSGYDLGQVPPDERETVLAVFRDYFNLCSEELWLASSGKIDKGTWELWRTGIRQVASFPSFASAWGILGEEYAVYAEFREFMDAMSPRNVGTQPESVQTDVRVPAATRPGQHDDPVTHRCLPR
jgi:hypothetical protein